MRSDSHDRSSTEAKHHLPIDERAQDPRSFYASKSPLPSDYDSDQVSYRSAEEFGETIESGNQDNWQVGGDRGTSLGNHPVRVFYPISDNVVPHIHIALQHAGDSRQGDHATVVGLLNQILQNQNRTLERNIGDRDPKIHRRRRSPQRRGAEGKSLAVSPSPFLGAFGVFLNWLYLSRSWSGTSSNLF